ncbi:MAG: hypothetical protein DRP42_00270 [Tenericutes bacterium]|nr:MAG: hypothetical protein DRP42_00270 [Mycoplasmatota bacterium]
MPKTDLINFDIELNEVGFIKVDSNKQTSQKGMFAIGDITEKEFRQITTSIADGTLAALSLGK